MKKNVAFLGLTSLLTAASVYLVFPATFVSSVPVTLLTMTIFVACALSLGRLYIRERKQNRSFGKKEVAFSACVSIVLVSTLALTGILPVAAKPMHTYTITPGCQKNATNDGEIYLVGARLDGRDVRLDQLDVSFGPQAEWKYTAENDDYILSKSNLKDPNANRLMIRVPMSKALTLLFSRSANGSSFTVQEDCGVVQTFDSDITDDSSVDTMEVFAGANKGWSSAAAGVNAVVLICEVLLVFLIVAVAFMALLHLPAVAAIRQSPPEKWNWMDWAAAAVLSVYVAFTLTFGLTFCPMASRTSPGFSVASSFCLAVITVCLLYILRFVLPSLCRMFIPRAKGTISGKTILFASFLILLLAWLPNYIAFYPALVSPDSVDSLHQALEHCALYNHHPILFTLYLKGCIRLAGLLGLSNTTGVGLAIGVQMVLMALTCALLIQNVYQVAKRVWVGIVLLAYFTWIPLFDAYAVTLWKDIYFAVALSLFTLQCYRLFLIPKAEKMGFQDLWPFCLVGVWLCFARNNGLYIFLPMCLIATIMFLRRSKGKVLCSLACALMVILIQGPGYNALNIQRSSFAESIGVPLQQIGYTVTHDEITPEEAGRIEQFMPVEEIVKNYRRHTADTLKFNDSFRSEYLNNNKGEFIELWVTMLPNHFWSYVKGYLFLTSGFWNLHITRRPGYSRMVNVYSFEPLVEVMDLYAADYWQQLTGQPVWTGEMPGVPNIASMVLMLFFTIVIIIQKKAWPLFWTALPCLLLWLTLMIATPIYNEHRYVLGLYMLSPVLLMLSAFTHKQKKMAG